ncbi:MAG: fluoride efflux transporter CrcB [Crocinitomicaceae bacterium]|nr:fluoride efflux transporter CrcB [Crocinitomicaceae bacterium]
MTYLYIFLGGGLGSLARFLTSKAAGRVFSTDFPLGTLIANLIACALLAMFVLLLSSRQQETDWIQPLLIVGFCGGYSTFSTFSNETFTLIDNGQIGLAIANVLISVAVGIGLIFLIRARA